MMTYEKVLRNLKMEHDEKMTKRRHPKLCREKPCQLVFLIAFLEAHPPQEIEFNSKGIDTQSVLV